MKGGVVNMPKWIRKGGYQGGDEPLPDKIPQLLIDIMTTNSSTYNNCLSEISKKDNSFRSKDA